MTPHLFDHVLFLVLLVALPLEAVHAYRTLRSRVAEGAPDPRVRAYRTAMLRLWGVTAGLAVGWLLLGRSWAELGLGAPTGTTGWALLAVAAAFCAVQLGAVARLGEDALDDVRSATEGLGPMLPANDRELGWFWGLSVTAGITEELLYRGFLIAYLGVWVGLWPAVVLSSAIFGMGHFYQGGFGPVLKTGAVGLVLGTLYVLSGSLWAPVLLHASIDVSSGWASRKAAEPA